MNGVWIAAAFSLMCTAPSAFGADTGVTIKGSMTILPLARVAAEEFMHRNPDIGISVQGGGSGMAITALAGGHHRYRGRIPEDQRRRDAKGTVQEDGAFWEHHRHGRQSGCGSFVQPDSLTDQRPVQGRLYRQNF